LLQADQRKDQFLALLAHELRNPLAAIGYALADSKSTVRTPAQREHAQEVIERQFATMSRLLDDLLDVSRMTMGKLELKEAPTEFVAVLETALEAARPSLAARGHTLSLDLPTEPLWPMADSTRLAQVFANLLVNSSKYTDPGGRLEISARVETGQVAVRVRDNGIGIPREMLPRLFAPFFQGHNGNGRAEGGLGIGLSLARGLVSLHRGTIEAFSEGPNRGSEFIVRLPAGLGPPAQPGKTAPINRRAPCLSP
jgi:two-component system CheB/CheR fusion protein